MIIGTILMEKHEPELTDRKSSKDYPVYAGLTGRRFIWELLTEKSLS